MALSRDQRKDCGFAGTLYVRDKLVTMQLDMILILYIKKAKLPHFGLSSVIMFYCHLYSTPQLPVYNGRPTE